MAGEDELDVLLDDDDEPKAGEPKALREAYEKLKAKLEREVPKAEQKGYEKAMAEVKRRQAAQEAATSLGNPKAADLFIRLNPDIDPTPEAIKEFFTSYGIAAEEPKAEAEQPPAFTPDQLQAAAAFHQAGGGTASTERLTPKELQEKVTSGQLTPEQAHQALRDGRVEGVTPRPRL